MDDDRMPLPSPKTLPEHELTTEDFYPDWRFTLAFLSLTIITLMVALDATSLPVALPIMAKILKGSALETFWSGTSFLLTSTIFQPVLGSFSGVFGRKPILFLSLILFGVGAIVAAIANNFTVILVGRSLQGAGGGGIITLTEIIVTDLVPLRLRGNWLAFIGSAWAIGTVTGPLLGGGFAQDVSWRWIFWINLPFLGLGTTLIIVFLHLNYKTSGFIHKLRRIDWLGTFLFTTSLTGFLIPLTWGGVQYPWSHWRTILPLILSVFGLILFVFWEMSLTGQGREPLIQLDVIKTRTGGVTFIGTFIHGMLVWLLLYFQPFYFEAIKGQSPILAGISLFPQTFTVAPTSVVAGIIIATTGYYRWATWGGWVLTVLGSCLLIFLKEETSTAAWVCISLVGGVGVGLLFCALPLTVQASSTNKTLTSAVILFGFFRGLGQSVGVAVGGVVFQNGIKKELRRYPLLAPHADEYSRDASSLVGIIKAMPVGLEKNQLLHSYMRALRAIYIVCTALAAVALVLSFWTEQLPLNRALETEQGFKPKEKKSDNEARNRQLATAKD